MNYLKQSTAVEIKLGPFLDSADGNTQETGLTISQADVRLAKNGGDWAQKNESTTMVHEEAGWYRCLLDTTDTGTLGILKVAVHESGALPVWESYTVLAANIYDSLVGGGDIFDVSVTQWLGTAAATPTVAGVPEVDVTHIGGDAQSGTDLKDFADAGYDPATNKVQGVVLVDTVTTLTGHTAQTGDAFARLGAPAGASVSADIAAIEAQTDDIGVAGAGLTALPWSAAWDAEVQSEVADALAVYDPPTHAELVAEVDAVQSDVAGVQSDTNDIQTRIPAALTADGNMKSDTLRINGSATAAAALSRAARSMVLGTVGVGSSATSIVTSAIIPAGAATEADQLKGRVVIFADDTTTAALRAQATDITANTAGATPTLTVTALTEAPANTDTFTIL